MLRIFTALLLLCLAATASSQALRVGVAIDNSPFAYSQDGAVVGLELDNARALGALLNRQIQTVAMPYADLLDALNSNKVDVVMAGLTWKTASEAGVETTESYLSAGQMAIVHIDKAGRFAYPWAIFGEGVRAGFETGSAGEVFVRSELTDASKHGYFSVAEAFAALRANEIDAFVHDAATSWALATAAGQEDLFSSYEPLTQERYVWAVRAGQFELLAHLNRALHTMKARGTLRYILDRWIPVTATQQAP